MRRPVGFIKRAPRIEYGREGQLVDSSGKTQQVTVLDISSSGFKLKVTELPKIGDVVSLHVQGSTPVDAQIRWAVNDQAGGVFLTPVNPSGLA